MLEPRLLEDLSFHVQRLRVRPTPFVDIRPSPSLRYRTVSHDLGVVPLLPQMYLFRHRRRTHTNLGFTLSIVDTPSSTSDRIPKHDSHLIYPRRPRTRRTLPAGWSRRYYCPLTNICPVRPGYLFMYFLWLSSKGTQSFPSIFILFYLLIVLWIPQCDFNLHNHICQKLYISIYVFIYICIYTHIYTRIQTIDTPGPTSIVELSCLCGP